MGPVDHSKEHLRFGGWWALSVIWGHGPVLSSCVARKSSKGSGLLEAALGWQQKQDRSVVLWLHLRPTWLLYVVGGGARWKGRDHPSIPASFYSPNTYSMLGLVPDRPLWRGWSPKKMGNQAKSTELIQGKRIPTTSNWGQNLSPQSTSSDTKNRGQTASSQSGISYWR